ncbi:MAG: hypothetical protein IPI06_05620 [Gammaproteobacteria bacterium]|nr:hypothetical protein [Gammaproteobacteria bacterium]
MFINFWYPVIRSGDLGAQRRRVPVLAHEFVVFRDATGRPAVLSDLHPPWWLARQRPMQGWVSC